MALPDKPLSREESYLSNIAGEETVLPPFPITRVEQYLDYIAKNGAHTDFGITGASVGEVATVAAVDGDGKPTAWGAAAKQDPLIFDTTPTAGSSNPVTSGGIKSAIESAVVVTAIEGTATLTNTQDFPFNDSTASVSLGVALDNIYYDVETSVVSSTGNVGEVEVSDKQINGFKLSYTGSASTASIAWRCIPRAVNAPT